MKIRDHDMYIMDARTIIDETLKDLISRKEIIEKTLELGCGNNISAYMKLYKEAIELKKDISNAIISLGKFSPQTLNELKASSTFLEDRIKNKILDIKLMDE